jgi:ketosteroid isomerase-like protein
MTASADPAEVIRAVCDGVSRLAPGTLGPAELEAQLDRLAALYAEQTDVRHPFAAADGAPLRTRAELRRHFAQVPGPPGQIERFEPVGFRVHQTADPEVVVTEFRYEGSAGGRPFSLPCVFVTRVRDGVITESRDYADHAAADRAFSAGPAG